MDVSTLEPKVSHKQEKAYPSSHAETIILYPCSTQPVILQKNGRNDSTDSGEKRYAAKNGKCAARPKSQDTQYLEG